MKKAELILHPARLQILQALTHSPKTTQELAEAVTAVPKSSIYRHLNLLLEGGIVTVKETRPVRGVVEKVYQLAASPHLGQEDMDALTPGEHLRYFMTYLGALLQDYADYLGGRERVDMLADRAGFTEVVVYATTAELDAFAQALNQALLPMAQNEPGEDRHRHKIAFITHPVRKAEG